MKYKDIATLAQKMIDLEKEVDIEEKEIAYDKAKGCKIEKSREEVLKRVKKILQELDESAAHLWITSNFAGSIQCNNSIGG